MAGGPRVAGHTSLCCVWLQGNPCSGGGASGSPIRLPTQASLTRNRLRKGVPNPPASKRRFCSAPPGQPSCIYLHGGGGEEHPSAPFLHFPRLLGLRSPIVNASMLPVLALKQLSGCGRASEQLCVPQTAPSQHASYLSGVRLMSFIEFHSLPV